MRTYGDTVETVTERGTATLDVYEYITGEKLTALLCGPHARKRRAKGGRAELTPWADKKFKRNSKCADCSPVKGKGQLALL